MFNSLVVIPAYNEEHNIKRILHDINRLYHDIDILVINDGSTDRTEDLARNEKCYVISLPYNLGYGNALQTGFKYAVLKGYEYIVQFDGDGQHNPEDIRPILNELEKGDVDIVIGSRYFNPGSYRVGFVKMAVILLFRFLIKITTGAVITDPTSGLRGLSRRVFSYYAIKGNFPGDYPDADILIHMIRCRYKVREIPADIRARISGKSMHSGLKPIYYFMKVLLNILVILLREKIVKEGCDINGSHT